MRFYGLIFSLIAAITANPLKKGGDRLECNLPSELVDEIAGYSNVVDQIIDLALGEYAGVTYDTLAEFVDTFGPRMTGSQALEDAIDFLVDNLTKAGLENVHTEDAPVPIWTRGEESLQMLEPRNAKLKVLGLGGTVGTSADGITAEILVVKTFDELHERASEAVGKIVVFNQDWTSNGYGEAVQYRGNGAVEAAKVGGVAALVRSVTSFSIDSPHTGAMSYSEGVEKIPTASVTVEDAEMLYRMQNRGDKIVMQLNMADETLPDGTSRNTIAELQGSEIPEKLVVISGHIDSWDVGQGAMDDASGAFISTHALLLLNRLGLRPRRTIRAIMWTAEEQGYVGAIKYASDHANETDNLDFVMESDFGTFTPVGLAFLGSDEAACITQEVLNLMERINATSLLFEDEPGSDIMVWTEQGIPSAGLRHSSDRYFWFHHSPGDTMQVYTPRELDLSLALWTASSYVIADLSVDMPRADAKN